MFIIQGHQILYSYSQGNNLNKNCMGLMPNLSIYLFSVSSPNKITCRSIWLAQCVFTKMYIVLDHYVTKMFSEFKNYSRSIESEEANFHDEGWQWCWWHRYIGDLMLVTFFSFLEHNKDIGDIFSSCWWPFKRSWTS